MWLRLLVRSLRAVRGKSGLGISWVHLIGTRLSRPGLLVLGAAACADIPATVYSNVFFNQLDRRSRLEEEEEAGECIGKAA